MHGATIKITVTFVNELSILISLPGHTSPCCIIFPLFPYICYSAVHHTLYHVSVCIVLLPILYMPIWPVPLSHQIVYILHLLSISVCNITVKWYFVFNAWSCAAIISLPVCPFRSPLNTHSNMSSPPIICLSTLSIYQPWSTLLYHMAFKESPNFLLRVKCFPFLFHCYLLISLNFSVTFATVLIVDFIFVWLLSSLKQYLQTGLMYIVCSDIL